MRTLLHHVETVAPKDLFWRNQAVEYLCRRSPANHALRNQRFATLANDWIGIHVNADGFYEKRPLDLTFRFLQPLLPEFANGLALDIGANIGNHSVYFDRFFARVLAFEPNPMTFQLLRFNAANSRHVVAHNFGLGDAAGTFVMRDNEMNVGGVFIDQSASQPADGISVEVKRLDDCGLPLDTLCLMKLDVEGFEPRVLHGGRETIAAHEPIILLEQHTDAFRDGSTEALSLLRSLGYAFCWEERPPNRVPAWRRVAAWCDYLTGSRAVHHRIVSDDHLAPADYDLIIAVPRRFQRPLGF